MINLHAQQPLLTFANVLAAIPLTPGGLGIIDTVIPILLVGFGLTRSVATLGVLSWRLVNFWLPIPAGAVAYASLKVPPGRGLRAVRHAFHEMTTRGTSNEDQDAEQTERPPELDGDHQDGRDQATLSSDAAVPRPESRDSQR